MAEATIGAQDQGIVIISNLSIVFCCYLTFCLISVFLGLSLQREEWRLSSSVFQRIVDGTRGRLVSLLRRGTHTVEELAASVSLTDNAVRSHLVALERDGLVRPNGVRRGGTAGKPATLYEISPEADLLFSRAYAPVLASLVEVIGERMSPGETEEVLRDVGRRIAAATGVAPTGELRVRAQAAVAILTSLGSQVELLETDGHLTIQGCGCPLAEAVKAKSETCCAVEGLLEQLVGAPVVQQCAHGERPSCRFGIEIPKSE